MKSLNEIKNNPKLEIVDTGVDGGICYIRFGRTKKATVVYSNGGGWEHVSVSFRTEEPTWDEMCKIKDIFFNKDECVIQYHPAQKDYVNFHKNCLHLWKPINQEIPMPPKIFV